MGVLQSPVSAVGFFVFCLNKCCLRYCKRFSERLIGFEEEGEEEKKATLIFG